MSFREGKSKRILERESHFTNTTTIQKIHISKRNYITILLGGGIGDIADLVLGFAFSIFKRVLINYYQNNNNNKGV